MLHDGLISNQSTTPGTAHHAGLLDADRRYCDRVPFPVELVLAWMHDLGTPLRFRVVDAGEGGFRIHTCTPVIEGMTGIAIKLLPNGDPLDRAVMVAWVGPPDENGKRYIGLRYF